MEIFAALERFHRSRAELSEYLRRGAAAASAGEGELIDTLRVQTADCSLRTVAAAADLVAVLERPIDATAWQRLVKALHAAAATSDEGIGTMAGVVAAAEGAQLIGRLKAG